jgi:hypothetical protein
LGTAGVTRSSKRFHHRSGLLQLLLKQLGSVGVMQICFETFQLGLNLLVAGFKRKREFSVSNSFCKLAHALNFENKCS